MAAPLGRLPGCPDALVFARMGTILKMHRNQGRDRCRRHQGVGRKGSRFSRIQRKNLRMAGPGFKPKAA